MPGNIMLIWFNLGMVFGGIAMVSSLVILTVMLRKNLTEEEPEQLLTPIVSFVCISCEWGISRLHGKKIQSIHSCK